MKRSFILFLLCCIATVAHLHAKEQTITVRLRDGRIQEYVNGSLRRSYGSKLIDAATDGSIVAGVTADGRVTEYKNGSLRRTFGSKVKRVRVSGGSIFADLENGRTAEYVNGSLRRTF